MTTSPFPNFHGQTNTAIYSAATSYRTQLRTADNTAADKNSAVDSVQIQYDDVTLTAKVPGWSYNYELRHQGKAGVTVSLVKITNDGIATVTAASKNTAGAYSGYQVQGYYGSNNVVQSTALSTEESEFLFNLHDPNLKAG